MKSSIPVLAALLLLTACGSGKDGEKHPEPVLDRTAKVVTQELVSQSFSPRTILPAKIEAGVDVFVAAETQGVVTRLAVKKGERVQAGQVLMELDDEILATTVSSAKEQVNYLQSLLTKQHKLFSKGLVSKDVYELTSTQLISAQEALKAAKTRKDKAQIKTTVDGIVTLLPQDPGEYVRAGDVIANVVDIDTVKALVSLPESDVRQIQTGDKVAVHIKSFNGKEQRLEGTVDFISVKGDSATRTYLTEILVPNQEGTLLPEMVVNVEFTKKRIQDAILIPSNVILNEQGANFVYLVRDNTSIKTAITKLGLAGEMAIVEGLEAGDKLITQGQHLVVDQGAVQVEASK